MKIFLTLTDFSFIVYMGTATSDNTAIIFKNTLDFYTLELFICLFWRYKKILKRGLL